NDRRQIRSRGGEEWRSAQGNRCALGRSQEARRRRRGGLMSDSDLEGDDMAILEHFNKRPSAASPAGRRTRETRPLAVADRRLISHRTKQPAPKRLQLNLKVLPQFHERVSALALNEGIPMIELIERAVEAYARDREK